MGRMKVLYLADRNNPDHYYPMGPYVEEALRLRHDLQFFDPARPFAQQIEDVGAVIDDGLIENSERMVEAAVDLQLWQVAKTGFDDTPLAALKDRGIPACNCPGSTSGVALGECAMMFIMMLTRRFVDCQDNFFNAKGWWQPVGRDLTGLKLGIIGFGASGQALARRARAFDMEIHAINRSPIEPAVVEEIPLEFAGTPDDVDRVIGACDVVSLHLPLNDATRQIMSAKRIGLMRKDAYLVNVSRGGLVDQEALFAAVADGKIAGAGLDVFAEEPPDPSHPAFQLPNLLVTPHIAGSTNGTFRNRSLLIADNLSRVADGHEPLHRIDA
jgi:D-3-phosphoglycerate dehydrogenase